MFLMQKCLLGSLLAANRASAWDDPGQLNGFRRPGSGAGWQEDELLPDGKIRV